MMQRILFFILLGSLNFGLHAQDCWELKYSFDAYNDPPNSERSFNVYTNGVELHEVLDNPNDIYLSTQGVNGAAYTKIIVKPFSQFYYNNETKATFWVKKIDEDDFVAAVQEDFEEPTWNLLPDTMTIDGFLCHKAQRMDTHWQTELTAWYTNDLNIYGQPKYYLELPGVLVKSNQGQLLSATKLTSEGCPASLVKDASWEEIPMKKYKKKESKVYKNRNKRRPN